VDDGSVWQTTDPEGRNVELDLRGWLHIHATHEELRAEREAILATVAAPERRTKGHRPHEEWFYRGGVGPSRWIRVVVHYEHDRGRIATAFPRRSFP
jgi:hypothetical protein